jgi:hypothetical protein
MNERNEGEEKNHTFNLMVQSDYISLQSFPTLNQTITPNIKKAPKYCYRLNPKHVPLSKELQPQLQNLENYTKIILDELIMNNK